MSSSVGTKVVKVTNNIEQCEKKGCQRNKTNGVSFHSLSSEHFHLFKEVKQYSFSFAQEGL